MSELIINSQGKTSAEMETMLVSAGYRLHHLVLTKGILRNQRAELHSYAGGFALHYPCSTSNYRRIAYYCK